MNGKFSVRTFSLTCAVCWGVAVFLVGMLNLFFPNYGLDFLNMVSSIYPGYEVESTFPTALVATGYAFLDGAIGGAIFAWVYNRLLPSR